MAKDSNNIARLISNTPLTGTNNSDAMKLAAHILSLVDTEQQDISTVYSVNISDHVYRDDTGLDDWQERARKIVAGLSEIKFRFDVGDQQDPVFAIMTIFSSVFLRNGVITATINPQIKPFMAQLKARFAEIPVDEVASLPSVYSQRLYKLLKSEQSRTEKSYYRTTVDVLRKHLGATDVFRGWRNFRRNILERAEHDIHEHTTLLYSLRYFKVGRKIEKLLFEVIPGLQKKTGIVDYRNTKEGCELEYAGRSYIASKIQISQAHECAKERQGVCVPSRDEIESTMINGRAACLYCVALGLCEQERARNNITLERIRQVVEKEYDIKNLNFPSFMYRGLYEPVIQPILPSKTKSEDINPVSEQLAKLLSQKTDIKNSAS